MKYQPVFLFFWFLLLYSGVSAQQTERQYLSGTGLNNTVTWRFRCSEGRNSGKWSKIEVPSQWELQGFGEYTLSLIHISEPTRPY